MADDSDKFGEALASNIRSAREALGMTVAGLAEASGVSRAMISKIERGEAQPTAVLLTRLSGALELTLSELIARAEGDAVRVARRSEQTEWTDPETGYLRRAVSPPARGILELVEVEFPAGASVASPASAYHFKEQQIWVLSGHLRFVEGDLVHELDAGDCLQLGPPADCIFVNPTDEPCRYLVVIGKGRG